MRSRRLQPLVIAVQDMLEQFRLDSAPGIPNLDYSFVVVTRQRYLNLPALRRELDCVPQHIANHLLQPRGITGHIVSAIIDLQ